MRKGGTQSVLMMVWPTTIDVLPMARARARQDKSQPVLN
jgi:hypothetical protein